jgi:predicted DNA-binding protein (MmcQ/YjbR family)
MATIDAIKKLALSFPETEQYPQFDKVAFRVKQKIFATLSEKDKKASLRLSLIDQSSFCSFDPTIIYPVPNKWGQQGWTHFEISKIKKEMLLDALTTAYCEVAPKKLAKPFLDQRNQLLD